MTANFYKALGLRRDADAAVVDAAYRSLAKKYHPDTADLPKDRAAEKFRLVQEAYEALRDPANRAAYDEQLKAESKTSRKSEPKFHKRDDKKKADATTASANPDTNWKPKLPYAAVTLAAAILVSFGISQFWPQWAVPVVSKDNDRKWPTVLQENKGSIAPADQNNGASDSNSDETGPSQVSKQIYDRRVGEAEILAGQSNQPETIPVRPLYANDDNLSPEIKAEELPYGDGKTVILESEKSDQRANTTIEQRYPEPDQESKVDSVPTLSDAENPLNLGDLIDAAARSNIPLSKERLLLLRQQAKAVSELYTQAELDEEATAISKRLLVAALVYLRQGVFPRIAERSLPSVLELKRDVTKGKIGPMAKSALLVIDKLQLQTNFIGLVSRLEKNPKLSRCLVEAEDVESCLIAVP